MLITINKINYPSVGFITPYPDGVHPDFPKFREYLEDNPLFRGLDSRQLHWQVLWDHILENPYADQFSCLGYIGVNFERIHYETIKGILKALTNQGRYKKYNNVWQWIPILQEQFLSTNWKKAEKKTAPKAPRRRPGTVRAEVIARPWQHTPQPDAPQQPNDVGIPRETTQSGWVTFVDPRVNGGQEPLPDWGFDSQNEANRISQDLREERLNEGRRRIMAFREPVITGTGEPHQDLLHPVRPVPDNDIPSVTDEGPF